MLFLISRAQAIDNVILMQSIGNVGINKLRKLTVHMCENLFQQNQMREIHLNENRGGNSLDENWFKKSNKYGGESVPNMF